MRLFALLLLCAPARAATLSTLEVLRALAAEQSALVQELPPPATSPATAGHEYAGAVRVAKGSAGLRRPKEALKDRSLLLEDAKDMKAWVKDGALARALAPGARAWVKGRFGARGRDPFHQPERMIELSEAIALPGASAELIGAKAQNELFSAGLAQVDAWCDHMPAFDKGLKRRYLVVTTALSNKTDRPIAIKLERLFLSFGARTEGAPVEGLFVRGQDGMPSGRTAVTLEPGVTRKVEWRGDGLFPENAHDKTLYVTLSLSSESKTLFVRGHAAVLTTE